MDAMPLGNGGLTATAWANVSAGGVSLLVGHQNAQSSHTELFKLGFVTIALVPNPFTTGTFFEQTLNLSTATLVIFAGGKSALTAAAQINVWVDANSDELLVDVSSPTGAAFSLTASVVSTRPTDVWVYRPPFGICADVSSQPDVFVDPVPAAVPLVATPAQSGADAFRYASGPRLPTRALAAEGRLPRVGSFLPGSVISFHRNDVRDLIDGAGTVNMTLTQQGAASLIATTPDHWTDLQSGFVLDSGAGVALVRASASTLVSSAPASAFSLRLVVLAVQTDTPAEWLTELSAAVAALPADPRIAHETWWTDFWNRSYITVVVNTTTPSDAPAPPPTARAPSLPVPGASLWLRASSLTSLSNNSAVSAWHDESGSGLDVQQKTPAAQPRYVSSAFGPGAPGVVFDGVSTLLTGAKTVGEDATILVVFRDDGSSGGDTPCCSGVVYFTGGCHGVSTVPSDAGVDDDDNNAVQGTPVVTLLDWPGSDSLGHLNIRGRAVHAAAVYTSAGSALYVDGCLEVSANPPSQTGTSIMIGSRNDELGRFFRGAVGEVVVFDRALNATELHAMTAYFQGAWPTLPAKAHCNPPSDKVSAQVNSIYAITRYTQAIQSRNTMWPIKFNGMAFTSAVGTNGEPEFRQWGPSNWWQNTRLPYGAMAAAGDFESWKVVLDYYTNMRVYLEQRTQLYWNHTGMWTTETQHLTGCVRSAHCVDSLITFTHLTSSPCI
jgi:hypothetical protein